MAQHTFHRAAEVYLFDTCTLKCGYCHLAETGKVLKSADLESYRDPAYIDRVTAFFNKRTTESQKWNLMLTGGEPLLMPNFRRFCENLFEHGNRVSLYSALVIDTNHPSFRFLLGRGAPNVDYIMASFHPEAELQEEQYWQRVKLLAEAGHNIFLRFVGHSARLHLLEKVSRKCQELDICFYPTTLFSKNYPHAYTDSEREQLASYFSSLSQAIQLAGGIDTRESRCFAGSRIIAVYLPTGEVWPCISVHSPVLGNVYEDRLTLFQSAIGCPEAGIACICDIHFQQNIVLGTDDHERFERQKAGFVLPMPIGEQSRLLKERQLHFTEAPKGIGDVRDDALLYFSKAYVKEQFVKNFGAATRPTEGPRPDIFVAALTPATGISIPDPNSSETPAGDISPDSALAQQTAPPEMLPCSATEGPSVPNPTAEEDLWDRKLKLRRPAITEGFAMPGFAGKYWIWPEEYALLAKYVDLTQGDYLEIGSMCGIIAVSLAEKYPNRHFVCVDAFVAGHGTIAGEKETFLQNVREHNVSNVTLIEGDSLKVVPTLSQKFDVVFIDGNHAYEYVLGDALNSWRLLAWGGFLVFHDYKCVEETTRAVNDFLKQTGARLVEVISSLAVACKPAQLAHTHSDQPQYQIAEPRQSIETTTPLKQTHGTEGQATTGSASAKPGLIPSPAQALWNQRQRIAASSGKIKALSAAIARPSDFSLYQWAELTAFALEFRPDLIVELGRYTGNSTCCLLEVANQLGGASACRVISLCRTYSWFEATLPRLKRIVPEDWFAPGEIVQRDILEYDFSAALESAKRCLVFWDAHGFEVAEYVLGSLLPRLAGRPHLVIAHDMSDARYREAAQREYEQGLWKGESEGGPFFWLGHVVSRVAQAVSIVDFSSRNRLPLHSAAESLRTELANDSAKMTELKQMLGEELFSLEAHWFWFTLNEAAGAVTFPRFQAHGEPKEPSEVQAKIMALETQMLSLKESFGPEVAKARVQVEHLVQVLQTLRDELEHVEEQKSQLEAVWRAVESSAGWRLLNAWREARDRMIPLGTRRRRLYDAVLQNFRGSG